MKKVCKDTDILEQIKCCYLGSPHEIMHTFLKSCLPYWTWYNQWLLRKHVSPGLTSIGSWKLVALAKSRPWWRPQAETHWSPKKVVRKYIKCRWSLHVIFSMRLGSRWSCPRKKLWLWLSEIGCREGPTRGWETPGLNGQCSAGFRYILDATLLI